MSGAVVTAGAASATYGIRAADRRYGQRLRAWLADDPNADVGGSVPVTPVYDHWWLVGLMQLQRGYGLPVGMQEGRKTSWLAVHQHARSVAIGTWGPAPGTAGKTPAAQSHKELLRTCELWLKAVPNDAATIAKLEDTLGGGGVFQNRNERLAGYVRAVEHRRNLHQGAVSLGTGVVGTGTTLPRATQLQTTQTWRAIGQLAAFADIEGLHESGFNSYGAWDAIKDTADALPSAVAAKAADVGGDVAAGVLGGVARVVFSPWGALALVVLGAIAVARAG